jgi:hypothetical protein
MTTGHSPHYVRLGTPEAQGQDDGSYAVTVPLVAEDPAMLGEWTPLLEQRMSEASTFFTLSGSTLAFSAGSRDGVGTRIEQVAEFVSATNDAYTDSLVQRNEAAAREELEEEDGPAGQWRADRQHTDDFRTNPKP